jgi:hypothetical protein
LSSAFYKAFSHSADKKQQIQRVVKHIFVLCSLQGIFSNSADKTAKPSMWLNTFCALLFARHFRIQLIRNSKTSVLLNTFCALLFARHFQIQLPHFSKMLTTTYHNVVMLC